MRMCAPGACSWYSTPSSINANALAAATTHPRRVPRALASSPATLLTSISDSLVEAISSGATALAYRPTDATASNGVNVRLQHAQYTKLSALATIAAIEMLAQHTGEPKLSERDWITRCAVGEAVAAWNEIREERNG